MNEKNKPIVITVVIVLVIALFLAFYFVNRKNNGPVACTEEAKICPDGSSVGRTGPNCEFAECPAPQAETQYKDLIRITSPMPNGVITSPLKITGEARGNWFFEASFPIALTDWDGKIIAEGQAQAKGDWMTEEYVPFEATLEFTSPYKAGDQDTFKNGTLILKKDNPSGDPARDDAFEIRVKFAN